MHITLTNDFHNTCVRVRVSKLPAKLSKWQVARIGKALCGIPECTCGGIRGIQPVEIVPIGPEDTIMLYALENNRYD